MKLGHNFGLTLAEGTTHVAPERESKPSETCSLAPRRESKPSRGTNVVRGEQESAETSSFRCDCERCRLSRGEVSSQNRGGKASNRQAAFTLAEVLITLGIIGVVAAMTLPSLIQNYQKKALATQTQKFYSTMSQAVKQYMADYGVDDLRNTPLASNNYEDPESPEAIASIRNFVTKHLKVVQECNPSAEGDNNCFAPVYRLWDNSIPDRENTWNFPTSKVDWSGYRDYVLADSTVIKIGYYYGPIDLYVDVNGKKGPNRIGYDLWTMSIFYDGVIDESEVSPECRKEGKECWTHQRGSLVDTPEEVRESRFDACKDGNYGGCFGHFLENGFKFDY